jgi:superfamily II DNA helicase RecQ
LPAYFVVEDGVLIEIARRRPTTADALADVPGVPPELLRRAGVSVLQAVAENLGLTRVKDVPMGHP